MARHNWKDVRAETINTPELEAAVADEVEMLALERRLFETRQSRGLSQRDVAERMDVTQANVSRIESAEDVQLSTLARYVEALGGHLQVSAVFEGHADAILYGADAESLLLAKLAATIADVQASVDQVVRELERAEPDLPDVDRAKVPDLMSALQASLEAVRGKSPARQAPERVA